MKVCTKQMKTLVFTTTFLFLSIISTVNCSKIANCHSKTHPLNANPWITRLVDSSNVIDLQKDTSSNREPTVHLAINNSYQGEFKIPASFKNQEIEVFYEWEWERNGKGDLELVLKPKVKACNSFKKIDNVSTTQSVIMNHK